MPVGFTEEAKAKEGKKVRGREMEERDVGKPKGGREGRSKGEDGWSKGEEGKG